jgi:hypothetical protein
MKVRITLLVVCALNAKPVVNADDPDRDPSDILSNSSLVSSGNMKFLLIKYVALLLATEATAFSHSIRASTENPSFEQSVKSSLIARRTGRFASELALGPAEAWSAYNQALESDPLLVKSITASVILGAGDLAGQALEDYQSREKAGAARIAMEDKGIDWARSARFAIFGLVLQAPWNHFYYQVLDAQIPPTQEPFTSTNGVKVVIDQFIQAPIFTVIIFVFLGLLEGKSVDSIKGQLKDNYKDTILANCTYCWHACGQVSSPVTCD